MRDFLTKLFEILNRLTLYSLDMSSFIGWNLNFWLDIFCIRIFMLVSSNSSKKSENEIKWAAIICLEANISILLTRFSMLYYLVDHESWCTMMKCRFQMLQQFKNFHDTRKTRNRCRGSRCPSRLERLSGFQWLIHYR